MNDQNLEQRFWAKVRKTDGCWIWESARAGGKERYGFFWVGGVKRSEYAHRVAYRLTNGSIPDGAFIMHSCDNGLCVNPSHLSVGDHTENMRDASVKNRLAFGEKNKGGGKLTDLQVRKIKSLRGALGSTTLGRFFDVDRHIIMKIWTGDIWARTPNCLKMALA